MKTTIAQILVLPLLLSVLPIALLAALVGVLPEMLQQLDKFGDWLENL